MRETTHQRDHADVYTGVIHFHSDYSHDGRDSFATLARALAADRIDFCVLTDHFEDFDHAKMERYLSALRATTAETGFLFVPAIEAQFRDAHVIFVPVSSYAEIRRAVEAEDLSVSDALKFMAHPSKYALEHTAALLKAHNFDGIELWNQMADGRYAPPVAYLCELIPHIPKGQRGFFFGNDIHCARHTVTNYLTIPTDGPLEESFVVASLRGRRHVSGSRLTELTLSADLPTEELAIWLDHADTSTFRVTLSAGITRVLKVVYRTLPRPLKKRLNYFKNSVKSRL